LRLRKFDQPTAPRPQPRRNQPNAPRNSTTPPLRAIGYASRNPAASGPPTRSRFATTNAHPATSIAPRRTRSRFASSNTPRQFGRPRRSQRSRPPSTPACHAGCFRSLHVERPTASRPRTHAAKPTPVEPRTSPDRFVRARLRCSSRASLPLTPRLARLLQQLECALPLRSGQRQSQLMDSFGLSGVGGSPTRPVLPASLPP